MAEKKTVLAVGAHPDDVEFGMAGTLMLLRDAGFEPHILTFCNGSCGTAEYDEATIIRIRREEAANAAKLMGAIYHPGLVFDLEVFYNHDCMRKACAIVREVNPYIMLVPSFNDYMEDHTETARVMVMGAFCKGMRNFASIPPLAPVFGDTFLYHALPHGLRDAMNRTHLPETFVKIDSTIDAKENMLRCHASQKNWLDVSQGMDSYLKIMRELNGKIARWSKQPGWEFAEGFRRHCHIGFSAEEKDPLREILKKYIHVNPDYEKTLNRP
jgi:N-acetylglucosamine malate deacetylase 1